MNDYVELTSLDLALAGVVLVVNAALSFAWKLGLGRQIAIAALRATTQLLLVGFVLEWIFGLSNPWAVTGCVAVMIGLAAITAKDRISRTAPGLVRVLSVALLACTLLVTFYGATIVLHAKPWFEPRVVIPIAGMLLGNTLTGVALSLDQLLQGFTRERVRIEALLAHGATKKEAMRDVLREATRTGLVPILNAMLVSGIVALPGMMTGQILSGTPPIDAVKYQIAILFLIAGATALGVLVTSVAMPRFLFDVHGRPVFERVRKRDE